MKNIWKHGKFTTMIGLTLLGAANNIEGLPEWAVQLLDCISGFMLASKDPGNPTPGAIA